MSPIIDFFITFLILANSNKFGFVIGFNEYLEKIGATKVLNGTFCSNIQNDSPIEEKRLIVGHKGIESIPIEFHKKLRYPTEYSTHIKKIESRNQE